jgi:MFS family permease
MFASGLVPVAVASALTCGTVLALPGCIRQPLAQRLGLSDARINLLLAGVTLTMIPLLPLAGLLIDHAGMEHVLIAGSLLAALGISLLALNENFATSVATVLLLGVASACLLTGTAVLLPVTFFVGKPAAGMNLGFAVVGLGIVLTPPVCHQLKLVADLSGLRWRKSLLLLALFCLLPALVAALTPANLFPNDRHADPQRLPLFQDSIFWVAGLACFLYLPLEAALVTWATGNLPGLGYKPRQAAWLLGGFWAAFLLSRVLMALVFDAAPWANAKPAWLLAGLALCLAVGIGNLAGTASHVNIAFGLVLVGCFCGPIYPTLAGFVVGRFPKEPGTAFGTMQSLGALASLLAAPMIAFHARDTTVHRALRLPLVAALLLAAAALVLGLSG